MEKTVTHICKKGKIIIKVDNSNVTSMMIIQNNWR